MSGLNVTYENKTEPISMHPSTVLTQLPHMHKEIEIVYVVEGSCVAIADSQRAEMSKGDIYVSFPNQVHFYDHCANGKYFVCIISTDIIPFLHSTIHDMIPTQNVIHLEESSPVHEYIKKCSQADGQYMYTELCGYINLIMGCVMPKFTLRHSRHSDSMFLRGIMNFCAENYMNNPTLDDAALALNKSKYYISHIMNDRLNLSFTDYLNTLRINAACDALKDTKIKITDISENVGFGTIRSFNRTFKEIMGITPQEYRKLAN